MCMVYYFTPFYKGDLGKAYNHYCELVPNDDDWITFSDGDVLQLHLDWGDIWGKILEENDSAGIVTCLTNRIGSKEQLYDGSYLAKDILTHKKIANNLLKLNNIRTKNISSAISGFFFSFKKSTWTKVGGFKKGILGVDRDFAKKVHEANLSIKIAYGFYVFHYYRFLESPEKGNYTDHLI